MVQEQRHSLWDFIHAAAEHLRGQNARGCQTWYRLTMLSLMYSSLSAAQRAAALVSR